METYSSSVEDQLIDGLSFKLNPGASYIVERKSVSYFPSGSNVYTTSSGTKVLRILINGDDWLDATNTLRIFFDVRNTGTAPLRVLGGPYSFWRRCRILCGSTLCVGPHLLFCVQNFGKSPHSPFPIYLPPFLSPSPLHPQNKTLNK